MSPQARLDADDGDVDGGNNVSCTGSENEGRSGSSDEEMNEDLIVFHNTLGYEKRFELRQCKRMRNGI